MSAPPDLIKMSDSTKNGNSDGNSTLIQVSKALLEACDTVSGKMISKAIKHKAEKALKMFFKISLLKQGLSTCLY